MNMFNKSPSPKTITNPRAEAQQKYNMSRMNLVCMIAFTVLNVVMLLTGSDRMLLFSASIPYVALLYGTINSVRFMLPALIIAFVVIAVYLVCWLLSKKNYIWMIVSLAMFVADSIFMIMFYLKADLISSGVLDMIFHAWVVYYIVIGIINGKKLKSLPLEMPDNDDESLSPTLNGTPIDKNNG